MHYAIVMERITFTAFFLSIFAACRSLQLTIVLKPDVGTVGDSVQFLVSTDPHNGFTLITWTVNGSALVTFDGTNTIIDPDYRERINFNITTGSLEMKSLTLNDRGSYQINIKASGESAVQHVTFEVLEGGVHNGLSGGAIAGIVIGVVLALGLFPAGFFILKKLRSRTSPVPQNCKGSTDLARPCPDGHQMSVVYENCQELANSNVKAPAPKNFQPISSDSDHIYTGLEFNDTSTYSNLNLS
ncbi:uncharacterized protein [Paramormyrops kingsleyae]|uniref:uncharacterized protein isoform X2 n=1 Tax=Paramormyrops kingsleyae TaxID=1676925 RepID=UPI003B97A7FA